MAKLLYSIFDEGLVTIPEAVDFLRISRTALYELMERGRLDYVKIGRSRRIPLRSIKNLAEANLRGPSATKTMA